MAETKNKAKQSIMTTAMKKAEKTTLEMQLAQQREDRDKAFVGLLDKYIESEAKLGADHFRTNLLRMFLEMLVPLKDITDSMLDLQASMSALADTTNLIDDCLKFTNQIMEEKGSQKYGFFYRMKQRRMTRKYIKNFENRMYATLMQIEAVMGITDAMRTSIGKMNTRFAKRMAKTNKMTQGQPATFHGNSQLADMIDSRKNELNMNGDDSTTPVTPPTGDSKSAGTSSDGVDISGIV